MEKAILDLNKVDFDNDTVSVGRVDDTVIVVKRRIPVAEKEMFALSLAESTQVFDDESGVAYKGYLYDVVFTYLFAKYYTNIDVSLYDSEEGHRQVYDFVVYNGIIRSTEKLCEEYDDDVFAIEKMYNLIVEAAIVTTREKNSLSHKIKTSFASVLADEDLATSLAKSQEVNEQMVDVIGAVIRDKKVNGNVIPMKFAKK